MPQETSNRLYVLLVILSIAIVVIAAGFYSFIVAGTSGVKLFNITSSAEQKWLSVSGSASAFSTPDTASVSLGVLTQAATAKEASEINAASMNAVINALKNLGIQDKDMRTSFLSIQPVYNYPKDGGTPTITAYRASNNVQITTKALEKLGDIVDKSVAAGANQVSDIYFTLSEEKRKQIRNELLADAVKDAETKADRLAESLKVRITGVKTSSISETGFQPFQTAPLIAERAATPIQPGESMVTISVEITYNIG